MTDAPFEEIPMPTNTAQPDRYVRAADWSRIVAALGLPASAVPAEVIAAAEARSTAKRAQVERDARAAVLRECQLCDEFGWLLDELDVPVDPARKCSHGRATEPPASSAEHATRTRTFDEPLHQRTDTEENP